MGFFINTRCVTRVRSFADCEQVFAVGRRKKKWPEDTMALSYPAKDHFTLRRRRTFDGHITYDCILYRTAMVEYRSDGRVIIASHPSISSSQFAWCVAPNGVSFQHGMKYISLTTPRGLEYHRFGDSAEITLVPTRPDVWEVYGASVRIKKAKNRSRCLEVRKQIKPKIERVLMLQKLLGTQRALNTYSRSDAAAQAIYLLGDGDPSVLLDRHFDHDAVLEAAYVATHGCIVEEEIPFHLPPRRSEWA